MMTNKCTATIDIMEPPIKTLILYPDKDSVILEAEPWVNYGDSTLMELTNSPDTKAATIMNFSGLSTIKDKVWKNLIDVNLKFRTSGYRTDGHTLGMYRYNDDNWQEIFVSWNNAPEKQSKIQTLDIPANQDSYSVDITNLVTRNVVMMITLDSISLQEMKLIRKSFRCILKSLLTNHISYSAIMIFLVLHS